MTAGPSFNQAIFSKSILLTTVLHSLNNWKESGCIVVHRAVALCDPSFLVYSGNVISLVCAKKRLFWELGKKVICTSDNVAYISFKWQSRKRKKKLLVAQLCPILYNPTDYSPPFFCPWNCNSQAEEHLSGCHFPSQGIVSTREFEPRSLTFRLLLYLPSH